MQEYIYFSMVVIYKKKKHIETSFWTSLPESKLVKNLKIFRIKIMYNNYWIGLLYDVKNYKELGG